MKSAEPARRRLRRIARGALVVVGLVFVVALIGGVALRVVLGRSLAQLDGRTRVAGLNTEVTIERDGLGVPTVRGADRRDVAIALGFLHAQERYFQMDLTRRSAAGELAELVGAAALEMDRDARRHRLRAVARAALAELPADERALLDAYTSGVNAGLDALGARPPEYLLLRGAPARWLPEDSLLIVLAMYRTLQGDAFAREADLALMYERLPAALVDFLVPTGTEWDAPLIGGQAPPPPLPGPEVFDLRSATAEDPAIAPEVPDGPAGSNVFAIAGGRTAGGAALLGGDMHLPLALPNIWYRAVMIWPEATGKTRRLVGVTLPGTPVLVAGSNGDVAWSLAHAGADTSDLVVVEVDPKNPDRYLTPEGARPFERHIERLSVHGVEAASLEVVSTIWGPLWDTGSDGRPRALRWLAHDASAVDLGLLRMEQAPELEAALAVATHARVPTVSIIVADRTGRIGWTLMGPLPRRIGHTGRVPTSWADGQRGWDGLLPPEQRPRVVDPEDGVLWAANQRPLEHPALGDGDYDLGARAGQLRDGLAALARAEPSDLLAIQLDDRARFLERWRDLLLSLLTPEAIEADPRRAALRDEVEQTWTGRASIDSVGYRLVRQFRLYVAHHVFTRLTVECAHADRAFSVFRSSQWEGPLWTMIQARPAHLIDPRHADWEAQLLASADAALDLLSRDEERPLATRTWGERNRLRLRHPLSRAVPQLARWLDLPAEALPGDRDMPRVQGPNFGASQRLVVAPGDEERGIFHMPGGQSGHPLSPFYRRGHEAWVRGSATPLLPGPTEHRLSLIP